MSVSDLTYMASENAFYSYKLEDGKLGGFTIEVLDLIWFGYVSYSSQQLTRARNYFILTRMLREGRVDFIADSAVAISRAWEANEYDINDLKVHKVLADVHVCLAVNNDVPKRLVEQLSQSMQNVQVSKAYQQIVEKHIPDLEY